MSPSSSTARAELTDPDEAASPRRSSITPRAFPVDLSALPRYWVAGVPVLTHIVNGLNLLFPIGERFFVRSVHAYLDQLDDPRLKADVRAFSSQEGKHSQAHDRVNQVLRDQGFEIDRFLASYRRLLGNVEAAMPPALRLAATAATEHFTAVLAEAAFSAQPLELMAQPMKELLAWHALEEIEHRAVAFDVLQKVNDSYALRLAGLAVATATLAGFWTWATAMLLRQDQERHHAPRPLHPPKRRATILKVFARGIREYVRPGFHPRQRNMEEIAFAWLRHHLPAKQAELLAPYGVTQAAPAA
jgi:uncharacterized protein